MGFINKKALLLQLLSLTYTFALTTFTKEGLSKYKGEVSVFLKIILYS